VAWLQSELLPTKKTVGDDWGMFHWPHAFLLPNHVRLLQGKIIKVKVKVKVAFISIIINDKNKLDTVITKN